MEAMAERLSSLENLYFPRAIQHSAITPSQRKSILLDLLSRDTAVFLGLHLSLSLSRSICLQNPNSRISQYLILGFREVRREADGRGASTIRRNEGRLRGELALESSEERDEADVGGDAVAIGDGEEQEESVHEQACV